MAQRHPLLPETQQVNRTEIRIVRTAEEFCGLRNDWDELHAAARGTIFQTFTWLWTWWKVYGNPRLVLRIITVRIDGRLVAVLPLYFEHLGLPGLNLGRLRFIGVYETYGEYTVLVHPAHVHEAIRAIAGSVSGCLDGPGTDLLSLFRFPSEGGPIRELISELRALGLHARVVPEVIPRAMMELPSGWDEYLSSLSGNEREALRRKGRALEKKGAEVEVLTSPDREAFSDYARLHGESWNPRGVTGYFSSSRFQEFLETVTMEMMATGNSRLYFLKKDGRRFSAVHAFFLHDQCCFYLSGLDRNHELALLSPGKVLLARVIRDAIEEGYSIFDFQGGDEEYKFRLGGKMTYFGKALFWRGGIGSARVVLFLGLQAVRQNIVRRFIDRDLPKIKTMFLRLGHRAFAAGTKSDAGPPGTP